MTHHTATAEFSCVPLLLLYISRQEAAKAAANLRRTPHMCSFPAGMAIPGYKKRAREVQRAAPPGSADRALLDEAWAEIGKHKAKVKARDDWEKQWWNEHHTGTCGGPGCRCGGGFVAPWGTHGPVRWRLQGCLCKTKICSCANRRETERACGMCGSTTFHLHFVHDMAASRAASDRNRRTPRVQQQARGRRHFPKQHGLTGGGFAGGGGGKRKEKQTPATKGSKGRCCKCK